MTCKRLYMWSSLLENLMDVGQRLTALMLSHTDIYHHHFLRNIAAFPSSLLLFTSQFEEVFIRKAHFIIASSRYVSTVTCWKLILRSYHHTMIACSFCRWRAYQAYILNRSCFHLRSCRLPKMQDLTRKLWWSFFIWYLPWTFILIVLSDHVALGVFF